MTKSINAFLAYVDSMGGKVKLETAAPVESKPLTKPKTAKQAKNPERGKPEAIQKAMQVPAISSSAVFKAALTRGGFKRDFDVGMIAVTFGTKSKKTPKQVGSLASRLQKIAQTMDPNARVDDVGITFKGTYYPHLVMTSGLANRDQAIKKVFERLQKECLAADKKG